MDEQTQHRTSATVRDRDVADRIVLDLTEQGIARERVHTRPVSDAGDTASARATGEQDIAFTESLGKNMGAGAVIGFLVGALAGALGVSLLFAPPWESGLAAGMTLAVALGVGYFSAGLGLWQGGVARTGEYGDEPLTTEGAGHAEHPEVLGESAGGGEDGIEVVVEAATAEQAEAARRVFQSHNADPTG